MLTLLSLRMSRRRWRQGSGEDTQKPLLRTMQSRGFWLGERVSRAMGNTMGNSCSYGLVNPDDWPARLQQSPDLGRMGPDALPLPVA